MSEKNVVAFLQKLSDDQDFLRKVAALQPGPASWADMANKSGFDCTVDELNSVGRSIKKQIQGDSATNAACCAIDALKRPLTEDQLDSITGGASMGFALANFSFRDIKLNLGT